MDVKRMTMAKIAKALIEKGLFVILVLTPFVSAANAQELEAINGGMVLDDSTLKNEAVFLRQGAKITGKIVRYDNEGVSIQDQETLYSYPWNQVDYIEIYSLRDKLREKEKAQLSEHGKVIHQPEKLYAQALSLVKTHAPGLRREKENTKLLALLLLNYEAIDLFKKAIDCSSDVDRSYFNKLDSLFTLLLIQAQDYLANGKAIKAQENYTSAVKFIKFLWQRENSDSQVQ